MFASGILRYKKMILSSIFCFYLGCGLTVSLLRMECAEGASEHSREVMARVTNDQPALDLTGVEYIALVLSSPGNEDKRDAIRMTWGNFVENVITDNGERLYRWNHTRSLSNSRPKYIKTLFAVGTKHLAESSVQRLETESLRTGDLLLMKDFQDSYKLLSRKLLVSLQWLNEHGKQLKYVIKCDDDSFVRIDLIVAALDGSLHDIDVAQLRREESERPPYKGLYWGYFDGRAHVYLSGKWKEEDWFLCDNYLPYALGGGYVISHSIVKYIASNADFLQEYNSEDVSMGVWTAALAGINRVHDVRFDTQWKSRGCQGDVLVRHKQTPADMFAMYWTLAQTRGKTPCKTETVDRKPYLYNWNVPPSKCCG